MSDILIRNMKMPKNYPYRLTLHSDGCVEVHNGYSGHGHYQAIELPNHGRLIDADELEATMIMCRTNDNNGVQTALNGLDDITIVRIAPTVLEASNVNCKNE